MTIDELTGIPTFSLDLTVTRKMLEEKLGWIAPFTVYPGEDELLALAQGGLRVIRGEETAKEY